MSSVIANNTNHKIIMLWCKRKLYLVCRLAGYTATLSCLPRLGVYLTIYLLFQMHNHAGLSGTYNDAPGTINSTTRDARYVMTWQKQIGCVTELVVDLWATNCLNNAKTSCLFGFDLIWFDWCLTVQNIEGDGYCGDDKERCTEGPLVGTNGQNTKH